MNLVRLQQPPQIVFGNGCAANCAEVLAKRGAKNILLVSTRSVIARNGELVESLERQGCRIAAVEIVEPEPTCTQFEAALERVRQQSFEAVVGLGGGSALDVAKLLAALTKGGQKICDAFGIDRLAGREIFLVCIPTTAGTGSEVSPIAVLLDEAAELKKGVVSPHLIPDAALVDPLLTLSVPAELTAATGMDALTHCLEAYVNKFAHPATDTHALRGIQLIAGNLLRAVKNGADTEARANVALGSLCGGMCLGPVGTAAIHALSYPLGGRFHVAHGVSNALLMPHVLRFNLPHSPLRHADITRALGLSTSGTVMEIASRGAEHLAQLSMECGIPQHLAEFNIPREAIPSMAHAAMQVTRLLKNNVRPMTEMDARAIYEAAF